MFQFLTSNTSQSCFSTRTNPSLHTNLHTTIRTSQLRQIQDHPSYSPIVKQDNTSQDDLFYLSSLDNTHIITVNSQAPCKSIQTSPRLDSRAQSSEHQEKSLCCSSDDEQVVHRTMIPLEQTTIGLDKIVITRCEDCYREIETFV